MPALKAALDLMGYDGGLPRPPLRPTPKPVIETLRRQLTDLGVPLLRAGAVGRRRRVPLTLRRQWRTLRDDA